MPVQVKCPNPACGRTSQVPDANANQSVRCKWCGQTFTSSGSATGEQVIPQPTASEGQKTIGRFIVRARVGAGAFGTVYRAFDPQLEREVALKVPQAATLESPQAAGRFLREAKAAAKLRHPHIVPVFEAAQDGDSPYIASAFIEGRTLAQVLDVQPLDVRHAAQIVHDLADALAYAHGQGVVHRDVKPANIMLDEKGRALLMDFGLAQQQADASKFSRVGAVLGTPSYMAPEQARGAQGPTMPASDQYSLGVVLYELLCGQTPFTGPANVVLYNVIHTEPLAPRSLNASIPPDLEAICLKAMAKRPEHRFASMTDLAAALAAYLWSSVAAPSTFVPAQVLGARVFDDLGVESESERQPRRRKHLPIRRLLLVAAVVALAAVGAVVLLRPETGSVRIELSDPKADVVVKVDGKEVSVAGLEAALPFSVGKHELEVTGKSYEPVKTSFNVKRGENDPVKVALVPRVLAKGPTKLGPGDALREGKILAPDLSKAKVLYSGGKVQFNDTKDSGQSVQGTGVYSSFACEVVGRLVGPAEGWGIAFRRSDGGDQDLQVEFERIGGLRIVGKLDRPIIQDLVQHSALRPAREFNTVLVIVRGKQAEIYVNSVAICDPVILKEEITPAAPANLTWLVRPRGGSIEIDRITVYSAESLPTPEGRLPVADPERRVAEWVLGLGGTIRLVGEATRIGASSQLPKGEFKVEAIGFPLKSATNKNPVRDADLVQLKSLNSLKALELRDTMITDKGLLHLKDLKTLEELNLWANLDVSDAGLEHLKGLTALRTLDVIFTKVTSRGVRELNAALPNCKITPGLDSRAAEWVLRKGGTLTVAGIPVAITKLTDLPKQEFQVDSIRLVDLRFPAEELDILQGLAALNSLELANCKLGDEALVHLRDLTLLNKLSIGGNEFTEKGLAHLRNLKQLRDLHIGNMKTRAGTPTVDDAAMAHLQDLTSLEWLSLDDSMVGDAGLMKLQKLTKLERLWLAGCKEVTDKGLEHLKKLPELRDLGLHGTKVTPEGIKQLKAALTKLKTIDE